MDRFEEHKLLHIADCMGKDEFKNIEYIDGLNFPPEVIRPERLVTGKDLIEMGLKQGPIFKEILNIIEDAQLEEILTDREHALNTARELVDKHVY